MQQRQSDNQQSSEIDGGEKNKHEQTDEFHIFQNKVHQSISKPNDIKNSGDFRTLIALTSGNFVC